LFFLLLFRLLLFFFRFLLFLSFDSKFLIYIKKSLMSGKFG
jgi:hypothetical protein